GIGGDAVGQRAAGRAAPHDHHVVPVRAHLPPALRLVLEPVLHGRPQVVPDVLGLAVLVETGLAELAAHARLLVAAPLGLGDVRVVVVDPDRDTAQTVG